MLGYIIKGFVSADSSAVPRVVVNRKGTLVPLYGEDGEVPSNRSLL